MQKDMEEVGSVWQFESQLFLFREEFSYQGYHIIIHCELNQTDDMCFGAFFLGSYLMLTYLSCPIQLSPSYTKVSLQFFLKIIHGISRSQLRHTTQIFLGVVCKSMLFLYCFHGLCFMSLFSECQGLPCFPTGRKIFIFHIFHLFLPPLARISVPFIYFFLLYIKACFQKIKSHYKFYSKAQKTESLIFIQR